MGKGKPAGIRAARKLRNSRRVNRWAQKSYAKANSLAALKANPLGGSSMAKGIVLEKIGIEAKQPNSAIRKCVHTQITFDLQSLL
jgi:small subunit ribosomal protein S23e